MIQGAIKFKDIPKHDLAPNVIVLDATLRQKMLDIVAKRKPKLTKTNLERVRRRIALATDEDTRQYWREVLHLLQGFNETINEEEDLPRHPDAVPMTYDGRQT